MAKYFTLDEIEGVLALHHYECVFELDAPKRILERLSVRSKSEWFPFWCWGERARTLHTEFKQCFIQSEIYCPHEGVDRLSEYNLKLG